MIEAFPLHWPQGYPVTEKRLESNFKSTLATARDGILNEIKLLSGPDQAKKAIISTNMTVNKEGLLTGSGVMAYPNPGAAVYFTYQGEDKVIACDAWKYLHDNLRAVQLTIQAMRGLDRWKCTQILSRAMSDMKALPMQAGPDTGITWWQILQVQPSASKDEIKEAYKRLAQYYHPDKPGTGNEAMFKVINEAYQKAIKNATS
jgi:hypothetical protein